MMKKIFLLIVVCISIGVLNAQVETEPDTAKTEDVFTVVEQMPEFPGGQDAFNKFLNENLIYPKKAKKNGIEGKVWVSFIVDKDGTIRNVELIKGIGFGCDEEVVRVVKLMPKWKPGTQSGKPVIVKFRFPINFTLR
jgi:protein TonB